MRELARIGCTHVVVNALPQPYALETGPPGEIYHRFYHYSPDLDQFVDTPLNAGTYPAEYLKSNLRFLQDQAALAVKYGLTPGMRVTNPRSVPESLLARYPHLRGARVDHPFRAYRPRYTLTLAHPVVRWHYAQLMENLLDAVPSLGFLITLINDSGSGFEYTSSLYPGRNGGAYLIREWKGHDEIADAAADNVARYYRVLRDTARSRNPDFRIVAELTNIPDESDAVLAQFDNGLDRCTSVDAVRERELASRGSYVMADVDARGSLYIVGIPCPRLCAERFLKTRSSLPAQDTLRMRVYVSPASLAPFDVNREIVSVLLGHGEVASVDTVTDAATRWVGVDAAADLVDIWELCDQAVREAPTVPLYGGSGFTWYRMWDRPLVPDIGAIPESERAYYEDHLLATFNNPHRVDLRADALWEIIKTDEASDIVTRHDDRFAPALGRAIATLESQIDVREDRGSDAVSERTHGFVTVATDLLDRLHAYASYYLTLRNVCSWIVDVHGYIATRDSKHVAALRAMLASELDNTRSLRNLWATSNVNFMPIHVPNENGHDYGPNFGDHLARKIDLMERYGDLPPRIDANFMWQMPPGFPATESDYIDY